MLPWVFAMFLLEEKSRACRAAAGAVMGTAMGLLPHRKLVYLAIWYRDSKRGPRAKPTLRAFRHGETEFKAPVVKIPDFWSWNRSQQTGRFGQIHIGTD